MRKKKMNLNVINFLVSLLHRFKANFNVILTIFQRYSHYFSTSFSPILTIFSNEATSKEKGSWDAQRDEEEEERNRKNRFKGKIIFSFMNIFNEVYKKNKRSVNRISLKFFYLLPPFLRKSNLCFFEEKLYIINPWTERERGEEKRR